VNYFQISYWKVDDGNEKSFSPDEIRYLTDLNSGQGPLFTKVEDDGEFEVTTEAQYKLEHPKALTAVDDKTFFSGAHLGITIDECAAYYRPIAEAGTVEPNGVPRGEKYIDFHTLSDPERRLCALVKISA
jgi:hypothetical protein